MADRNEEELAEMKKVAKLYLAGQALNGILAGCALPPESKEAIAEAAIGIAEEVIKRVKL